MSSELPPRLPDGLHDPPDALVALAVEGRAGASLLKVYGAAKSQIADWLARGWLKDAGTSRPLSIVRDGPSEPAFRLAPENRQLLLRTARASGRLGPLTLHLEEQLGVRSQAALIRKLQNGSLIFRRDTAHRVPPDVRRQLILSLSEAFDSHWLQATYGDRLDETLTVALRFALEQAAPLGELYAWLMNRPSKLPDALRSILIAHAIFRDDLQAAQRLAETHDGDQGPSLRAAIQVFEDPPSPQHVLPCGEPSFLEPLVLVATLQSIQAGHAPAILELVETRCRALSKKTAPPSDKSAARLIRRLAQNSPSSPSEGRRLDPHRMPPESSTWEWLLSGLCAIDSDLAPGRRAAWAKSLEERSVAWRDAEYFWLARQGLQLAIALAETLPSRPMGPEAGGEPESRRPGDLLHLLPPQSDWEKTLTALARSCAEGARPRHEHRLRFFVEVATLRVGRPGREEYQPGRGWHLVERIDWRATEDLVERLPEEDCQVLASLAATSSGTSSSDAEAVLPLVALIGHPRVCDAAAGGLDVAVCERPCVVRSDWVDDELRLRVIPQPNAPGWSARAVNSQRIELTFVSDAMWNVAQNLGRELRVPRAGAERALGVLGRLADGVAVESPELDVRRRVDADSTVWLRWSHHAGAWLVECGVKPFGDGGRFFPAGEGPALLRRTDEGRVLLTVRNFDDERARVDELIASCPALRETAPEPKQEHRRFLGVDDALSLVAELQELATRRGSPPVRMQWPEGTSLRLAEPLTVGALRGALQSRKGWYLLRGGIPLDAVNHVRLSELARAPISARGRFVTLPDGSHARIDSRIRRLISTLSLARRHGGELRLESCQIPGVIEALSGADVSVDDAAMQHLEELRALGIPDEDVARAGTDQPTTGELTHIRADLRPYQRRGVEWLSKLAGWGLGACLADEMGLGKTLQILACLAARPSDACHLVITPASVCENWRREAERFTPTLPVRLYRSPDALSRPGLVIMSYGQLVQHVDDVAAVRWDGVVLDEAQLIKNPKTQRSRAALALSSQFRIAATGTPIENHLGDLWGVFRFLNPGLLGSWRAFSTHFVGPIERDGQRGCTEQLNALVRPFILRRTKNDVLDDLPPITRIVQRITLSQDDALRYAALRRRISEKLRTRAGRENHQLDILAEITRLRRFCCHPRLVVPEAPDDSAKLRALLPLLDELEQNGRRALVFSQYVDFLAKVEERLIERGTTYETLDGRVPRASRQPRIDRFMKGEVAVFLMSLKAGGLGLNLTEADVVIHLDPWWNPAAGDQATDRVHRIGQRRAVTSIEFITEDTIEEDILALHTDKRRLAGEVLDDSTSESEHLDLVTWFEQALATRGQSGLSSSAATQASSAARLKGF